MKKDSKGFTLAEMLIVVAIIGVLVATMTTTISNALERAREATDLANLRSAYAAVYSAAIFNDPTSDKIEKVKDGYRTYVRCKSTQKWWQTKGLEIVNNCITIGDAPCGAPNSNKPCIRIRYYESTGKFEFLCVEEIGTKVISYN